MRMELSNIKEPVAIKIKMYCVKNKITQGEWAEKAHNALINKV